MTKRARRWSRILLMVLGAIILAMGALLIARRLVSRQIEVRTHTPLTGDADWQGDWELSARGADPSQAGSLAGTDRVTIPFTGTRLSLRVRRGDYRAYFWIRIDGEPANRLPQTERGAYLVLSSPDYEPQTVTIPIAGGLDEGRHVAEITADRGWDQWPLIGWRIERGPDTIIYDSMLAGLAASAAVCLVGLVSCVLGWQGGTGPDGKEQARQEADAVGEGIIDLRAFSSIVGRLDPTLRSPVILLIAVGVFYLSPFLPLTLISGAAVAGLVMVHLDWGLALVALSAPFYLHPRPLLGRSFSMTEILILMCLLSWGVRKLGAYEDTRTERSLSSLDVGVLALVLISAVSTVFAEHRHVALRELRVVVLEPALFYLMLRTTKLGKGAVWRIVDGFVVGAAGVALIGLIQYLLGLNVITAEQGFRRLRSVYGSPNNAALYLGRALPMGLAVAVFAPGRRRRLVYSLLTVPVALALLLSFSRGAILIGVPVSLLALGVLAGGRWRWIASALIVIAAIGVIPLLSTPRFVGLLDPRGGTLFFRLQLWRASWKMFEDHPWLGVGPDNFLYQYRGRYILPSAWQEPHLSHAHNIFLTFATRLGIPGLAVGLWLHAAFWRHSLALSQRDEAAAGSPCDRRALALGLMGSMAYTVAHGMVDASTFFVDLAVALLLGLALVQWAGRYQGYEREKEQH